MANQEVYTKAKKKVEKRCQMKILAICGSPRKGNSYKALNEIGDEFPHIEYEILRLKDLNLNFCKGCYGCVVRGEEKCPLKDDRDMIIEKMMEADGVIFASPVYSLMVSALILRIEKGDKDKEDYYYKAKIPAYKKFIAKKVSDKIISQFD